MLRPKVQGIAHGWSLEFRGGPVPPHLSDRTIPATVPGCVHTDLLASGLIADPYFGANELTQQWIGQTDATYTTSFEWAPSGHERAELVFHGVDTAATVILNGVEVGRCENMHLRYRFDVPDVLRAGANMLEVAFRAPIPYANEQSLALGPRPHVNDYPYNAVRKMACSFGWDWGPVLATSGIWKTVELHEWSGARIDAVRIVPEHCDGDWKATTHVDVVGELDGATVSAEIDGLRVSVAAEGRTALSLQIDEPRLWWPRGWGEQHLYTAVVRLELGGQVLESTSRAFGLRTAEIVTQPDEFGTGFVIRVNGRDVRVRGANWIPADGIVTRVDRELVSARLSDAESAGMNLLRVWGGGIYESDDFYTLCDERGMLVWQDFLFACAAYAEEEPLRSLVEQEVRQQLTRLASHPSLVLLNGNNENLVGYEEWGWPARLEGRSWGEGYYRDILPSIAAELAPHVPYTPGSPFSPVPGIDANDQLHGTVHIWDVWNQRDYRDYVAWLPRFVAEFGWQAPPSWASLVESIPDSPMTPESPSMVLHQKAAGGNDKLTDGLTPHLPLPTRMEDWHWAMSVNQAHALRCGIEHFRTLGTRCSGVIIWQLNDCWPATSWALVDSSGRRKPAFYAVGQAFQERILRIDLDAAPAVRVANDSAEEWEGVLAVERLSFDGTVLGSFAADVVVASGEVAVVSCETIGRPSDPAGEYVRATMDAVQARALFLEYREASLDATPVRTTARRVDGHVEVTVQAESLAWDVSVLADVADPGAVVDSMLVTLDAGTSHSFRIVSDAHAEAFLAAGVVRTVNDLVDLGRGV